MGRAIKYYFDFIDNTKLRVLEWLNKFYFYYSQIAHQYKFILKNLYLFCIQIGVRF
jgi:hypothetical protein